MRVELPALWIAAAEKALGWASGTFLAAYQGNRASANDLALESCPAARPILEILEKQDGWSGTAQELLDLLETNVDEQIKRQKGWPKNPKSLSGQVRRLSPNLRAVGWALEFDRQGNRRELTIRRLSQPALQEAPVLAPARRSGESSDGEQIETSSDAWHRDPNVLQGDGGQLMFDQQETIAF